MATVDQARQALANTDSQIEDVRKRYNTAPNRGVKTFDYRGYVDWLQRWYTDSDGFKTDLDSVATGVMASQDYDAIRKYAKDNAEWLYRMQQAGVFKDAAKPPTKPPTKDPDTVPPDPGKEPPSPGYGAGTGILLAILGVGLLAVMGKR